MKINENDEIDQLHDYYEEYVQKQTTFSFENMAETIELTCKDKDGKIIHQFTYQPLYINTHLNVVFQDKGEKSAESLYEYIRVRKEE